MPSTSGVARRGKGHVRGRRQGDPPLPTLPNAHLKQNHKYSIKEVDAILEACARYRSNPPAREWLRREYGVEVTYDTLVHYREARAPEVTQRRDAWLAALAEQPLAQRRERVVELCHLLAATVREALKVPCPACRGVGSVVVPAVPKRNGKSRPAPPAETRLCGECRGLRWVLPGEAREALAALQGDVRLDTVPPALLARMTDAQANRCQLLLKQIQEEVGDHWSPRDKGQTSEPDAGGRHLHLHGDAATQAVQAFAALLAAPSDQVVALYQARRGTPRG